MIKKILQRPAVWGTVVAAAIIALVAFLYFYPEAARGDVLRQYDMQQGMAIGHEAQEYEAATGHTPRWTNSLFSGMPTFQIAPSYPSNRLFGWISSVMGLGLPSPANLLAMMMIGFLILGLSMKMRWYVALAGAIAYGLSSYFVIIIGAGHIWKFVTLAYIPPTIAGIVLAYRGRYLAGAALAALFAMMQISSNHAQMTYYFLFVVIGFVVAALIQAIREKELKRWGIATASLVVAAILAVGANLPSLYNTYEYSKETMRGNHSELTSEADPENATDGLNRDYITQYSYGTSETWTLLIPDVKGGASAIPVSGQNQGQTMVDLPEVRKMASEGTIDGGTMQYLQYMSQYFGEPEGTSGPVYVGALVCALFLLGCCIVRGPLKWIMLALTILSILLALGRNCMWLTNLMIDYLPMYSRFRTPESILVVAEFTMPLMAMLALQKLVATGAAEAWTRYRKPLLLSFGAILAVCLIGIIFPGFFGSVISDGDRSTDAWLTQALLQQGYEPNDVAMFSLNNPSIYQAVTTLRHSIIRADALRSFCFIAAGFGFILLYMRGKLNGAIAVGICGILILADLFSADKRYLSGEAFVEKVVAGPEPFPMTATDRAILADTTTHYRVLSVPEFSSPAPSYRHKAIGGYHAAKLTRYQDLIDRHLIHFAAGMPDESDWRVADMLNARYVVGPDGQAALNDRANGNAWFVDGIEYVEGADAEMDRLGEIDPRRMAVADERFAAILGNPAPADSLDNIRLTTYAPDRLTYHATTVRGALAVFSEVFFPWGWHATIDGTPVEIGRVDYLLRAIPVPAGSHTIEMWFDPQSLHTTVGVATTSVVIIYLAIALAIILAILRLRRGEPKDGEKAEGQKG